MAKPNRKGRNKGDRYIGLCHYMIESPAWRSLSGNAIKVLIAVWRRHDGKNNSEISFSVREAKPIGLTKDQTARAFKELTERGFLRVARDSRFTLKTKEARLWEITAERCAGAPPTKDFMKWRPPAPPS